MGDNNQNNAGANAAPVDLNQVRKNKREKLAALQAAGKVVKNSLLDFL